MTVRRPKQLVEFFRQGANPVPGAGTGEIAKQLEDAGWDGLAVGEAHGILPDPYAVLAVAAAATTRLKVATAVAIPIRHPMLAADAMATVQGLSNGRAVFGIGRGDGGVKVLQQAPMRVADFEVYISRIQGYLRREIVDIEGNVSAMGRLYDIDPSLDVPKPPLDVAATGPKTIELAARRAESISFSVGASADRLRHSIEQARAACEADGREFGELALGCYIQMAVVDRPDDPALEAIRGLAITHARFSGFEPKSVSADVDAAEHGQYRHAVETMEKVLRNPAGGIVRGEGAEPGELTFYPREAASEELIRQFAIVGDAEYCAERLQELVDVGLDRIWIGTKGVGVDLHERNALRIGREVLPHIRR
ncbi:MAG: LLM class flavin-dependent oxidoreductase [Chloroflexi bacterium]|nr:MAG: LLM class flavin-dependent oxidoreductase [Chloroflexota bacterium]